MQLSPAETRLLARLLGNHFTNSQNTPLRRLADKLVEHLVESGFDPMTLDISLPPLQLTQVENPSYPGRLCFRQRPITKEPRHD